jgi:high-affinity nickel-transport protein
VGLLWGLGHALTIFVVGGAIVVFGLVIPPRLGLGMELSVALMLLVLGGLNVGAFVRDAQQLGGHGHRHAHGHGHEHVDEHAHPDPDPAGGSRGGLLRSLRPLLVGIVHGLAGSAAVALLVLATVRDVAWALGYLLVFGAGTIAGMMLITGAMAAPLVLTARRFAGVRRLLGVGSGLLSVALGGFLVYEIGFVHGLFTGQAAWTPQ